MGMIGQALQEHIAGANQAAASAPALVPPNPPFDIQGNQSRLNITLFH